MVHPAGIHSAIPVQRQRNEVELETKRRDKRELLFPVRLELFLNGSDIAVG